MPKQTFFNLPEEKRNLIIHLATEEFASRPFSKASLSSIVSKAGIAKGSMYQYFEDKKDLFLYIVGLAVQEKMEYLKPYITFDQKESDFFTLLEEMLHAGTRFGLEHPKYGQIVGNVMEPNGEEVLLEIHMQAKQASLDFFSSMIESAKDKGKLRADVDADIAAYLLYSILNSGLAELMFLRAGLSMRDYLSNLENANQLSEEVITQFIKEVVKFLRYGLQGG
ncbi:TetR/AcrR family transcriptional regulator [Brevibacillus sp. SYSU BS000544]|uniref:TetR/AcrR family transcriptional regulator n=1 Tax=Brevibacillus sp. SYSU BS000544 TaxID=3416443 RepID=UPI003CE52071